MEIEIKELFDSLYLIRESLNVGQLDFIEGCKKQLKRGSSLSGRQISILRDMVKYSQPEIRYTRVL